MNLKDINFKKAYSSDYDDLLNDFYIPALECSNSYERLAGFFSSTSLAIAARGILGIIKNNGSIKLLVSPKLMKNDIDVIVKTQETPEKYIENKMLDELDELEDEFIKDHLFALGWLIANTKLEIKVAIPIDIENVQYSGLFHQKVGILKDSEGNIVSFSGSINETAMGWLGNIEEFKVFKKWELPEEEYVRADVLKFNKYWNNKAQKLKVMNIPQAIKKKLIEIAPKNIDKIHLDKWYKKKTKKILFFKYQKDAIKSWISNGMNGIFEMATGTGKTFTALGCLKKVLKDDKRLVTIIVCPYGHLVKQWLNNIYKFDFTCSTIIADSSNYSWKNKLMNEIYDINIGITDSLIVLTTLNTFSEKDFISIIRNVNVKKFLIVDEVHGAGAKERKKGLIEDYHLRLGLSATPKRWLDIEGSETLFDYFHNTVFKFSLKEALNTINPLTGKTFLVPYEYKPYFVELTDNELEEYESETIKIARSFNKSKNNNEAEKWQKLLLINRQRIIVNAENKLLKLEEILNDLDEIKFCLFYCSPQQINQVQEFLNSYKRVNIIQHKFTTKESNKPDDKYGGISEREYLLNNFAEGSYNALVAIKCLDEGVDIPPVKKAVILASSGNPIQYIQRRGRILRRFPGKEEATIYDIIVIPSIFGSINPELLDLERKIIRKELKRYKEFASLSLNAVDCLEKIELIEDKYRITH